MTEAIQTQDDTEGVRYATPEEVELSEWALETRRKTLTVLTESLKQFVALDAGLIGGAIAVFNTVQAWAIVKAGFIVILLASLAAALCGSMPLTAIFLYNEDAKEARDKGITWRSRCLWCAASLLFVAFGVLVIGVLPALFGHGPPTQPPPPTKP